MSNGKVFMYGARGAVGLESFRLLKIKGYDLHLVGTTEETFRKIASELNTAYTVADVMESVRLTR